MGKKDKSPGLLSALLGKSRIPHLTSPPAPVQPDNLPYKIWTVAQPVEYPSEIPGYILAYHYEWVKAFPPWEFIRHVDLYDVADAPALGLMPEPENKYDHNAVALYWQRQKIGYLLKGRLQDMANTWLKRGWPVFASFQRGAKDGSDSGLMVSLAFYKPSK